MDAVILRGVKTHNLKNINLMLPHQKFYVVTGVSGSGKSSLAFDTLYAEGQRRYVESLSAYARQFLERMEKPDAESIAGIPPAIAIEAKNVITNARSTVGTQTEINDYLRVLFARAGHTICPDCGLEVVAGRPETAADLLLEKHPEKEAAVLFEVPLGKKGSDYLKEFLPELERQGFSEFFLQGRILQAADLLRAKKIPDSIAVVTDRLRLQTKSRKRLVDSLELAFRLGKGEIRIAVGGDGLRFSEGLRCFQCGKVFKEPAPGLFSFNSPLGACPVCQGFGRVITLDWNLIVPDLNKSIAEGAIEPWTKPSSHWEFKQLLKFSARKKIPINKPWKELSETQRQWILQGLKGEDYFSVQDFFDYLGKKTYKMHVRIFLSKYRGFSPCPACKETRLKPEALYVKISGKNIQGLQSLSLEELGRFFETLKLTRAELDRSEPVLLEIKNRVRFLNDVGLGYLNLSRLSRTLSGGEVQRIHLATSLGSALVDTLYVLDEPSIGLHERDNRLLIRLLRELRDLGNTVVVVEHDRTMIEAADEVIDLGPESGGQGGRVVFQGSVESLKSAGTLTGDYLSGRREVVRRKPHKGKSSKWIKIRKAAEHNLKGIDVNFPLRQFVVITGISGSGKSTLLYDILYRHYLRFRGRPVQDLGNVGSIQGFEQIDEMLLIDQSPIGRTPRSNPATYVKAFDEVRKIFAGTPSARRQGFGPGHFSFNVDGGRCPVCKGDGRVKVEMHFLADVYVVCEECQGKRFRPEILEITYQGQNVDDVLAMTLDEACKFFAGGKNLVQKLGVLQKVGLGYLRLGQSATTLSGGEAQRLKLACEMTEGRARHVLYLFDEPTTGLHDHDIHYLMGAFEALLERGHSLVVIEHNMEVIRSADYLVDLGPEGGERGGELIFSGPYNDFLNCTNSYTAEYLRYRLQKKSLSLPAGV